MDDPWDPQGQAYHSAYQSLASMPYGQSLTDTEAFDPSLYGASGSRIDKKPRIGDNAESSRGDGSDDDDDDDDDDDEENGKPVKGKGKNAGKGADGKAKVKLTRGSRQVWHWVFGTTI
jgi:hypothetical protein